MYLLIINGPNLNLLGVREKSIYGSESFESYFKALQTTFSDINFVYYQSNIEGELVDKIHEFGFKYDGIIINAGAYGFENLTSVLALNTALPILVWCPYQAPQALTNTSPVMRSPSVKRAARTALSSASSAATSRVR